VSEDPLFQRFGKVFPANTVLFKEGEAGNTMFVLQTGKVKITKQFGAEEKTLAVIPAGEFLGEMAILLNEPRSASAIVMEEVKALVIDANTFDAMIKGNTEIAHRIIKKLAQRVRDANQQIESLSIKDLNQKVVYTIMRIVKTQGTATPTGTYKIPVGREELMVQTGLDGAKLDEIMAKLLKANLVKMLADGMEVAPAEKLNKFLEFLAMREQFADFA
jgi:CRP/FNR family transcriptional regulator, cyclic AMP receptor protein